MARASLLRRFGKGWRRLSPRRHRAKRLGNREARAQAVFVESISGPCAAEPGMPLALNLGKAFLRSKGGGVVLRVFDLVFAEGQRGIGRDRRIEADEQRLVAIDAL